MGKARDVRRGASRFKHSRQNLFSDGVGEGSVFSEKSKKERLRRLSAVGEASSSYGAREMGRDVSDREDELRGIGPSKRFKLPRKFLDDYNGVDRASVPRKLRSVMKKRSRESISPPFPDSKRPSNASGIKCYSKDSVKKPKPNMKQGGSHSQTESGPITKDEEEVVETLYALAGMFPNNVASDKPNLDPECLEVDPSGLPEPKETHMPTPEALNDKLSSVGPLTRAEAANLSCSVERSAETVHIDSVNKLSVQDQSALQGSNKVHIEVDNCVPELNLHSSSMSTKSEAFNFGISSEVSPDAGLKRPPEQDTSLLERKPENALGLATTIGSQLEPHHTIEESKKNDPKLWPGLSSIDSHGAGTDDPCLPSSAAKVPAWLDAALCTSGSRSVQNGSSIGKVAKVTIDRNSCKRYAAHVYISHLIQALHMSKSKDRLPLHQNQMRPHEGLKQGVVVGVKSINGRNIGLNGVVSTSGMGNATVERNSNGSSSGNFHRRRLHIEQPHSPLHSEGCTYQKQSFDFLSLSAGVGGLEASDSFGIARKGLDTISQLQVPSLPSLVRNQTPLPLSFPPSLYSSAYPDYSSAQQGQMQLPHGNPFYGFQASSTALTKQRPQQQQQQQPLWATHYRQLGTSTATVQFPNWQNERQETSTLFPCAQTLISPSHSTLGVVGSKNASLTQQQQPLMGVALPFTAGRVIRQDHPLPSVYEDSGGRFYAGGALPLQCSAMNASN
ncbi:uncharacterized protein LOC107406955 isoform X2 [Ziziphus jujuba]|uniref:Uncharacterized protein LOC107406955 isoform X2 n=2 Tax=Ziziphus jujuba TaxID=326968 RepID=A0A6P3YY71_ZIZJJ|nr:uncharacterized protein LOC107406955 isoform X2 [Ziziphus jujuba]